MQYINYLVFGKYARGTEGHLNADDLAAAIAEHDGSEAYYNHFDVLESGLKYEVDTGKTKYDEKKKKDVPVYRLVDDLGNGVILFNNREINNGRTFKGAEGACRPAFNLVGFDFDHEDDPQRSLDDVQAFLNYFRFEYFYVAFSGSKGFHISVPFEYFGLPADENLPRTLRNLAHELREKFSTLDTSVYNIGRKFRALNTKHGKTGLYKSIISNIGIDTKDMNAIKGYCETRHTYTYDKVAIAIIEGPNKVLVEALATAKATAEYDKSKAGTALAPTKLEAYDDKTCIKRLFQAEIGEGERNTTCLILINDLYKCGKSHDHALQVMTPWIERVMPESRMQECYDMIDDIYQGDRYYNHGCLEPIKSKLCSAQCALWTKLKPEKRPVPVDAPKSAFKELQVIHAKPATEFIKDWLGENAAVVTLANNWYLHGDLENPVPRNVIEDRIFNASDLVSRKDYKMVSQNKITAYLNEWENTKRRIRLQSLVDHLAYEGDNDTTATFLEAVLSRGPTTLEVNVLKHWLWLVKRKIKGLPVERELMLVIAGITNTGKTQAVIKLFKPIKELVDTMMLDSIADERHDFRLTLNAVVFFDEMAVTRRVNVEALKNKITAKWLNYRPLGKTTRVQGKNLATFIGTSNSRVNDIIKDPTSSRRYYEFWVDKQCDWAAINKINYVDLWRGIDELQESTYIHAHITELVDAQESFRAQDSVEEWLEIDELVPNTGEPHDSVKPRDAYACYISFMKMQHREKFSVTIKRFFNRMTELGHTGKTGKKGQFYKIKTPHQDFSSGGDQLNF